MVALPVSFLADLAAVYDRSSGAASKWHARDLHWLGVRLDEVRSRVRARLAHALDTLPEDDPLRCPISLFGTLDLGRVETAHTKALAWLFDPAQTHGFGAALVEAVVRRLAAPRSIADVVATRVDSECNLAMQQDRLDILARGRCRVDSEERRWMLAIEAKVDALEGDEQLSKYDAWLEAARPDLLFRVFLTPSGVVPETSAAWQPLSFDELAGWLRAVGLQLRDRPGYHFLRFYLAGVFRDICGWRLPISADHIDPYAIMNCLRALDGDEP